MRFGILGPLRVSTGPADAHLARRERVLLATLLLQANRVVSRQRISDAIWGDSPPRHPTDQIHGCVYRLRRQLVLAGAPTSIIATDPAGYQMRVDAQSLDLLEFRGLREQARAAAASGKSEEARARYRAALDLWCGPALDGIDSDAIRRAAAALDEEHLQASEERIELELALGETTELIAQLTELVQQHPYRENLHGNLMLALYRAGRQADALAAYRHARRLLDDELGAEPSSDLQELHRAILNRDEDLALSRRHGQPKRVDPVEFQPLPPQTMPPDVPDFVGREPELRELREHLASRGGNSVAVLVISGPAGVGKTALSVHLAHALRGEYPDGQLFVNLRGFDRTSPADPAEMLGRLLRLLGVEGTNLPASLDERTELYRSILSKRRVLIVLDNAATDDQVSPLIPGSQTCTVIANSRARLGTAFGARRISLDVLSPRGATALVAQLAGSERVDSDPDAVAELTLLCGYLPLAVRVAAGRLARKPHWSVRRLADQLSNERMRLDHLSQGQLDVRASISLSFASLSRDARRLLRRLGDLDLSEAGPLVSAALLDSSLDHADQVLEEIYDAQLIDFSRQRTSIGARYCLHDLVRLFAKERAHYEEPSSDLSTARRRAFDRLTTIAAAAHKSIFGGLEISGPATQGQLEEDVVDLFVTHATDWVDDERQVIAAAVRRAAQETHNERCWRLACAVTMLFQLRGYYDDLAAILEEARTAAEASGDSRGLAATLFRIGTVCMDLQEHDRALAYFGQAGPLFERVDDQHGYALTVAHMATVNRWQGNTELALQRYQDAVDELRASDDRGGQALVLRCLGQIHLQTGDYVAAEAQFARALSVARASGSTRSEAQVLFWQGMLRLAEDRYEDASLHFAEVLGMTRAVEDRFGEAQARRGLALCLRGRGDLRRAEEEFRGALSLIRQPRPTFIETQIEKELSTLNDNEQPS